MHVLAKRSILNPSNRESEMEASGEVVGAGLRRPLAQELQPKVPFSGYHRGGAVALLSWDSGDSAELA